MYPRLRAAGTSRRRHIPISIFSVFFSRLAPPHQTQAGGLQGIHSPYSKPLRKDLPVCVTVVPSSPVRRVLALAFGPASSRHQGPSSYWTAHRKQTNLVGRGQVSCRKVDRKKKYLQDVC